MSVVAVTAPRGARGATSSGARATLRDLARVALVAAVARVGFAAVVLGLGFRVVSDDDFARVVIAQRFAAAPKLDPTGTSWLPLPFWVVGSAMKVLGPTLEVARALAVVSAALSGALVALVAVAAGLRPRRAMAAAVVAAAMPWGMQLAVATVPEVPAAACAAAGAIALASPSRVLRLVGATALLASTWSRYDAWPLAIAFAALCSFDALREPADRRALVAAAAIAVLGPVTWATWQHLAFGDAFRFLGLVRSYRKSLGTGPSLVERVVGYPYGLVEEMREVFAAGVVGAVCAIAVQRRPARSPGGAMDVDWSRPLALALLQLVVLIAGDVRDGAPTHHPERALLGPATILLFASADAVFAYLAGVTRARAGVLATVGAIALFGWIGLRMHRSLPWYASAPRPREVAAGRALAAAAPVSARVLVDTRDLAGNAIDYGYYAVLAAFGRPVDAEIDRDQDPRRARGRSSFESPERLRARMREAGARVALVWGSERRAVAESLGATVVAAEATSGAEPKWYVLLLPSVP